MLYIAMRFSFLFPRWCNKCYFSVTRLLLFALKVWLYKICFLPLLP